MKIRKVKSAYCVNDDAKRARKTSAHRSLSPPAGILKRSGRSRSVSFQFEDGMVPQEMAAAVPMPGEQKVNTMFAEMVVRSHLEITLAS